MNLLSEAHQLAAHRCSPPGTCKDQRVRAMHQAQLSSTYERDGVHSQLGTRGPPAARRTTRVYSMLSAATEASRQGPAPAAWLHQPAQWLSCVTSSAICSSVHQASTQAATLLPVIGCSTSMHLQVRAGDAEAACPVLRPQSGLAHQEVHLPHPDRLAAA